MTVRIRYDIHGVTVGIDATGRAFVDALDRRLLAFRSEADGEPDVSVEVGTGPLRPPPGRGRPVYDPPNGKVLYFDEEEALYLDHAERVRLLCLPGPGVVRVSCATWTAQDVWVATHPLFTIALVEVLKRRGRFSLHAACAAVGDRGILLAGPSGSGKSTLVVALALAGLHFVSDDTVFLSAEAGGVGVLGFPDEVDVTPETVTRFPALAPAVRSPGVAGRCKGSLRIEDAADVSQVLRCTAAAVVFPTVAHADTTQLIPTEPGEALLTLAPNVLLTQAAAARAHLAVLGELAGTVPSYRLLAGRDLEAVPDILGDLLR